MQDIRKISLILIVGMAFIAHPVFADVMVSDNSKSSGVTVLGPTAPTKAPSTSDTAAPAPDASTPSNNGILVVSSSTAKKENSIVSKKSKPSSSFSLSSSFSSSDSSESSSTDTTGTTSSDTSDTSTSSDSSSGFGNFGLNAKKMSIGSNFKMGTNSANPSTDEASDTATTS